MHACKRKAIDAVRIRKPHSVKLDIIIEKVNDV